MSSQEGTALDEQIMQAARKLAEDTAVPFTIDALAAHTGLSRATIYRQTGGKKAILQRLAAEHGLDELEQPDARSRILQAAHTLFARYGLLSPTIEQIATEAGVGVATVYRHFGDRNGLLRSFMQAFQPRLPSQKTEFSGDLAADVEQLVRTLIHFVLQNREMVRLSFSSAHEWRDHLLEVRPFQERSLVRIATFLQNQMEAGRLRTSDPRQAATALLGMIMSFCIIMPTYYALPDPDPEETAVFIANLFLDGLKQP